MIRAFSIVGVIAAMLTASAGGVTTQFLQDDSATDFKAGKLEHAVISNLGTLSIGLKDTVVLKDNADVTAVYAVGQLSNGATVIGTGPNGLVLKATKDEPTKWTTLLKTDQPYISAMVIGASDKIYVGTSGTTGKVYEISPDGTSKLIFENAAVKYIWRLVLAPNGRLLAATGPNGKIFLVDGKGSREVFSCKQKNIVSLAADRNGKIFAGTDTEGLIYELTPTDTGYTGRAVYDSEGEQISAITVNFDDNMVYFATASGKAAPGMAREFLNRGAGTPVAATPATKTPTSQPAASTKAPTASVTPAPTGAPAAKSSDKLVATPAASAKPIAAAPTKSPAAPTAAPGLFGKKPAASAITEDEDEDGEDGPPTPPTSAAAMPPMPGPMPSMARSGGGLENRICRLDPRGFVTEIFKDRLDFCSLTIQNGALYAGTWPDGLVFRIAPANEEIQAIFKSTSKFVYDLCVPETGAILLATGAPGTLAKLGPEVADQATFTSKVLDAQQIAQWGNLSVTLKDNADCIGNAEIQTRTSVVGDPDDPAWSKWSTPSSLADLITINSPTGRFIQYKITFKSRPEPLAIVDRVRIAYIHDNRAPKIASVDVPQPGRKTGASAGGPPMPPMPAGPGAASAKSTQMKISWKASDPDDDTLSFTIYVRPIDATAWLQLEKNLDAPTYSFDSGATPDGRYVFKVVASDKASNPVDLALTDTRISDPVLVDNTAPEVTNLRITQTKDGRLLVRAQLIDKLSNIAEAKLRINSQEDWLTLAPADGLFDSRSEYIETLLPLPEKDSAAAEALKSGTVWITLKATDDAKNVGYGRAKTTITEPK